MKPQFVLTALTLNMAWAVSAHATTDAGTILRDATEENTITPATVAPLTIEKTIVSTDTTPITVNNVILTGNTLLDEQLFEPLIAKVRGTTTTFGRLQTLAHQIGDEYHKAGFPLTRVIVPAQKIDDGTVRLQVIEGRIDTIAINNQSRLSNSTIKAHLDKEITTGQPLRQADSERALLLLKDLSGTNSVSYRLAGGQTGTNLVVELGHAPMMSGFVQVDNHGSLSTGVYRTRAGLHLNSPFGLGERISLQGMTSLKGVNYARASADVPVGSSGLLLSAGGGHTRYELGGTFKNLQAMGTANTADVALKYPLLRSNHNNIWLSASGEHRILQDKINATNTVNDKTISAGHLGVNGHYQNAMLAGGQSQWGMTYTLGQLRLNSADNHALDSVSAKTAGVYHKVQTNLSHTQYLFPKLSLTLATQAQWTNKNLDPAEQMSLGGADKISAYHANDVSADVGLIGQVEVRYALLSNLALSGFYDVGRAKLRANPYTTDTNIISLHGSGVGLTANYQGLSLQGRVAVQDITQAIKDKNKDELKWWVKAGYYF